jgi:hypothetical protein
VASLSAADILRVWETGAAQDPVGRALTILAAGSPGLSRDALGALPVGRRDERLMAIREETFGPTAVGVAPCPRCAERVEFTLELAPLRARGAGAPAEGELQLEEWRLRYHLPSSDDLAAARGEPEPSRRLLAERCLVEVRRRGEAVTPGELPPEAITRLAAAMAEQDPLAEVLLDFRCPSCSQPGQTLFDIAAYLWEEIRAQALRLLREVDALARAYGWREADILAMSAVRRRAYLEMAAG